MRLLKRNSNGALSLTEDLTDDDIQKRYRYAILSHRWEANEVTFEDMASGTSKSKEGYTKLQFCGDQAARDGLEYFWVDTCCINKSNNVELQYAINSMFRWYRDAVKCYVYLSDVSTHCGPETQLSDALWESDFRNSRWFTRGWTLQELIAPSLVEFFSKESTRLGDRISLERQVCEITGIPAQALRGSPLSDFSVTERCSWIERRETKYQEDKAYSLLGIFGVFMSLNYGEGKENAFMRLREEIKKALKGTKHEDFSVTFNLSDVVEAEQFVARGKELAEIHTTLSGDGSRRIAILHGLGGMGKTQLSIAYAKRHRNSYSAIFWLNIKDEDSLKQSFAKVARQILQEHPSTSPLTSIDLSGNLDDVVNAVKIWLSLANNTRWLLIYDNYDNPKLPGIIESSAIDIRKYLPESYQGSVIVTTRSSRVTIGHRIHIQKLENVSDCIQILATTSRREVLTNDEDAIRLAEELDGLPLALATAGAYLDQAPATSLSDYLRLYKASWLKLQQTSPELSSYEDRMLYSTWQISYEHVKQQNYLSAKLLQLWGYLDNQDIWLELLQHSAPEDPEWIRMLSDELSFNSAMGILCNHGLVEANNSSQELIESKGYSMHGCTHAWTVHVLNQAWDLHMARLAVTFVASHIPSSHGNQWWVTQQRVLQHADRCSDIIVNRMCTEDEMEWAFHRLGSLYADQGKLGKAEEMYMRALQGKEEALGPKHTSTLNTVNNLGNLYNDQGKLGKAEEMYMRALQGYEEALGPKHTSTLDTVNNLGILYKRQGKLGMAEEMYMRALQGKEEALGPKHTSTLDTVNNLGNLYLDKGKLGKAEEMYMRAMQGYEEALEPETLSRYRPALRNWWSLAALFAARGEVAKAKSMYVKALSGYQALLGPSSSQCLQLESALSSLQEPQEGGGELEVTQARATAA